MSTPDKVKGYFYVFATLNRYSKKNIKFSLRYNINKTKIHVIITIFAIRLECARGFLMTSHRKPIEPIQETKRDFLYLTTAAMGVVATGAAVWPFIDSMNPAADVLALSTTEVDISHVEIGQAITVMWRGNPVFIRRRNATEIKEAREIDFHKLPDPANDEDRVKKGKDEWLVLVGVCTHLGCVPGNKSSDSKGDFGGWLCPCHGSHYDTSGRIRKGPAPQNLAVPPYQFVNDKTLLIG